MGLILSNKFLILQLNDKHVDESYDELLAKLAKHTPKFIEVQRALRTNGAVQRNQLIKSSEYMFQFSNIAKGIWTHCANNFYTKSLEILFGNDLPSEITEQITAFVKGYKSKEKPAEKYAYAEGKIRTLEAQTLLRILLFDINKINIEDSVVQSVDAFVQWNTALRKISNLERHHTDFEFELKDEDFELILEFLNQQDFEISLPLIAKGTLICKAIVDGVVSSIEGETLEEIYSIIEKRIDKVCEDSEASSLKVYEQRLNNLVWGPSNYQRDETFIRDAADSLEENKIVALYGLGGVGKTALAQKLMFDIINNREPYTHIVTHSSKVGSDQKEINTIGHKQRGLLVETDARLSVMDSSLVDDKGMRVIGGLRNLLLKIYKEATGESGEIFGDSKLKKEVFSELKKPENKLLIILDNFEDVEDNQDDPDVQEIRSETKSFLKDFSKQNDITSRIISTTRSSPMDVAYGIEVKHLTKSESVDLFAEKIRFRSQRTKRKDDDLTQRLIGIHQKIRSSNQLKNQLIESFDQWDTHDNHIAHPLIVLLAAEAVEHDDMIHLQDVIKEYGEGTKHSEVIEYCVSKTLGSFKQHEKYLLQVLIQNSNLNTEITTKLMHDIINNVTSNMEDNTGGNNPIHTNLLTINDSEIIDIMTRLSDRTFVRVIPKRIASGGVFWSWNKIVYDYLKSRFSAVMIEPQVKREFIPQEDLKSFPEFLTPLDDWINASTVTPLGFTQIVKPLENSVNMMHRELAKCVESGEQTYELDSLVSNLDRQSYLLIKIL